MEDSSREWCTVVNKKQQKRRFKQKKIEDDKRKWDVLQKEYPHIIMPARAQRIKRKLNIDGLDKKLMSDEWIEYQKKGWKYVKVLKPDMLERTKGTLDSESLTFSTLSLCNGWGDMALFCIPADAEIENSSSD
uniref:Uncharacterized protein n=1 Tax=Marseillevirus LCMAC101 TaxID=2506602 RepID=A0A481YT73_9VIRU|nr:MAG: hypothetical protein LCMAC101_07320 [Marseillevirus LCMAC101]